MYMTCSFIVKIQDSNVFILTYCTSMWSKRLIKMISGRWPESHPVKAWQSKATREAMFSSHPGSRYVGRKWDDITVSDACLMHIQLPLSTVQLYNKQTCGINLRIMKNQILAESLTSAALKGLYWMILICQ